MKKAGSYFRWSYRSSVVAYLALIAVMSGLSAIILGSLINRSTILAEMTQSQYEMAITVQQLESETDLTTEEVLRILERSNLHTQFVPNGSEEADMIRALMGGSGIAIVGAMHGLPITCVLTSSGLVYITAADQYNLYSSILTRAMSVSVFCIAAFLLASLWGSKRISHPITELTEATRAISRGDFSVRVPENERGEVGDLMRSFNSMTEELERTSYVQKDFISSVSHEFKTPIASIKGYARLLSMPGLSDEDREEYVHMIASESDRLARLSNTMLRLTALEQQGKSVTRDVFRLDEQVRQVIVRMQTAWQQKEIHWDLELKEVTVTSDSALLEQVWTNLIQNAIKFSGPEATIHIRVWEEKARGLRSFQYRAAMFEIRDEGVGMSEEEVRHIFERFYQADTSRSSEGVGLGLSLVRRILDMVGAHIDVSSVPGEGSVFRVSIPSEARGGNEHG